MESRPHCNVALLSGTVTDVTVRLLASGDRLAVLSLRVPGPRERATSVPIVVFDPPGWLEHLDTETDVVVLGSVHRRFFRLASGATGTSTELVASTVVRSREHRRIAALVRRAEAMLEDVAV